MGLLKVFFGGAKVIVETCGDKIGYLFKNSLFNVSTSTVGVVVTGASCARSITKGILSPNPLCKGLYFTSAALNGASCAASGLCLVSGYSCMARLPLIIGSVGYITSVGARSCSSVADCMDPTSSLTEKGVNACIDLATKNWS